MRVYGQISQFTRFNHQSLAQVRDALSRCCGASEWVEQMLNYYPYTSTQQVFQLAEQIADGLLAEDWLEAFSHHPQIGDLESLREKFAATAAIAAQEQAGSLSASEETLQALAEYNKKYLEKFGYIFIVCASGKSAEQMLALLQQRLENDPESELAFAAAEQRKITRLRLEKLLA